MTIKEGKHDMIFAIRNNDAALSVYEMDLPEVLADKQRRIEKAFDASRGFHQSALACLAAGRFFMENGKFFCRKACNFLSYPL